MRLQEQGHNEHILNKLGKFEGMELFDTERKESGAVVVGRKDWTRSETQQAHTLLSNGFVSKQRGAKD